MKRLLVLMMCAMLAVPSVGMNVSAEETATVDENTQTADQVAMESAKVLNDYLKNKGYEGEELKKAYDILRKEEICNPIIIGQSMGGYVGQAYAEAFPDKLKGFVSVDSAPLQRKYLTFAELWLLKRMEPVYRYYPWKSLLKSGTNGVATSEYGRALMHDIMMVYDGEQKRYAKLSGHGFKILAEAIEKDLPYEIKCPALLICGEKDHAGSCIRYNKVWHKNTGIRLEWIKDAGHNSNTDKPEIVNGLIEEFVNGI
mgnify:CR=1 FL=1